MKRKFQPAPKAPYYIDIPEHQWGHWVWQAQNTLHTLKDFSAVMELNDSDIKALQLAPNHFQVSVTPYYASLINPKDPLDPIRRIFMPDLSEMATATQQMKDPLGEIKNRKTQRLIHRYSDRVLLWVTDTCQVYCRYCTRKHFTASGEFLASTKELNEAYSYIEKHPGIREVILSGGDPLTLSDDKLESILERLRAIEHIEIIRIGTRMPVVNPFRVTTTLVEKIKKYAPVFLMTHFNHPRELTQEAALAITRFVDNGIPVMNQMVLLNGVNNSPAIVQALSRRLLYLRAKPYYMFQCDPSEGTDYLRTNVDHSLEISRELWGHLSGLAMPTLSLDIPNGGGKATLVPDFETHQNGNIRFYEGWDGVKSEYVSPPLERMRVPSDSYLYESEWELLKNSKTTTASQGEHILPQISLKADYQKEC